jgi:FKBP-type peptidyl-prolyl cis-trans isomerase SlyD
MKIAKDTLVSIHYKLTDDEGSLIDSSEGQEPLEYLHGHGQIVPGLERALEGRAVGEAFDVLVTAEEGYGEYDPKKVLQVRRAQLPDDLEPEAGMRLMAESSSGDVVPLWVTAIEGEQVTLDANHPLAGQTLHFAIRVQLVRTPTEHERAHGHAHEEASDP